MKQILYLFFVTFLISSCATHKNVTRYITKHPEILTDFVDTTTKTVYVPTKVLIDTTIYDTIPGDTVREEVVIEEPCVIPPVYTSNDIASARAWVEDGMHRIELIVNDQYIQHKIDSAVALVPVKTETKWLPSEPYIPKSFGFYRSGFFILLGLFLITIVLLVVLRR